VDKMAEGRLKCNCVFSSRVYPNLEPFIAPEMSRKIK